MRPRSKARLLRPRARSSDLWRYDLKLNQGRRSCGALSDQITRAWRRTPFVQPLRGCLSGLDRSGADCDTTSDTTQSATPRNTWQPRATEVGLDKPILQHPATPGNKSHRFVAQEKVAGSSPVGHPP